MPLPLEDYALIGDTQGAALVGRNGSIDWLCLPRFDSPACFAALLGGPEHGRWLIAPAQPVRTSARRYRERTLIVETDFETDEGAVRIIDFMPIRGREPDVVRIVQGLRGRVRMQMELVIRFDYGRTLPWVRRVDGRLIAIAGPDALTLDTDVPLRGEGMTTAAEFDVTAGQHIPFVLAWHGPTDPAPNHLDPMEALAGTEAWWQEWAGHCTGAAPWHEAVVRSLITLKALTYAPTGGIVAAPTTSLPEQLGGVRNWDYRYCWLRDATFTLYALMTAGYQQEAEAWRDWLLRAVAGAPADMQIMYGVSGERRLPEMVLPWLPGYEGAAPVRIGNAASTQFQLDVFGEVMDAFHYARTIGIEPDEYSWDLQRALMEFLESTWREPDEGIWEVRGPRRHFTHSKVMAWVAFDRAVKAVEHSGKDGPVDRWRRLRTEIHGEICSDGYDSTRGTFTQYYGSKDLDASLLMIALVGFLPPTDPRVVGTVDAIQSELAHDGFLLRYPTHRDGRVDGLPSGEGAFLPCSFWLVDNLALMGRYDEAVALFERLLAIRNDLGLLSEEYDAVAGRLVGNFPQAFSHLALVDTAYNLTRAHGPAAQRKNNRPGAS